MSAGGDKHKGLCAMKVQDPVELSRKQHSLGMDPVKGLDPPPSESSIVNTERT